MSHGARSQRAAGLALWAAFVVLPTWADEPTPPDVIAWIGTASTDAIQAFTMGDLSGHGTRDWAGIVRRPASTALADADAEPDPLGGWQIVVFLQQPGQHYRLAVQSPPFSYDCGTSRCWMEDMHIERQSLFVQRLWSWHGCFDNVMFQFKARDGGWPLIGVKSNSDAVPYPDDGGPTTNQIIDYNRVTGDVIVTRRTSPHPARATHMKIVKPLLDLADFVDFNPPTGEKIPGVCGG